MLMFGNKRLNIYELVGRLALDGELDDLDIAILRECMFYPQPTYREIGKRLNKKHHTLYYRVKRIRDKLLAELEAAKQPE